METTPEAIREALAASVGGMERLAGFYSWRTMMDLNKRAAREVTSWQEVATDTLRKIELACADEGRPELAEQQGQEFLARFVRQWAAMQFAASQVASPMVTGPAKFPADRNRKKMETERRRYEELEATFQGAPGRARKACKRARQDEAQATQPGLVSETQAGAIRVVENGAQDRLQLIFPDKPSDDERAILKRHGFRWSPRNTAWQRQLTDNARVAARRVLAQVQA